MLSLAIKARIPVIRAHTTDLLNLPTVLAALAPGMKVLELRGSLPVGEGLLLYALDEYTPTAPIYELLAEAGKVLVLINQGEECSLAFNAGEVPVPKALMEDLLLQITSKKKMGELLPCFSGLTLKAMHEVIQLTTAKEKSLTARGIAAMRASLAGKLKGLGQVDAEMPLYLAPAKLEQWITLNKKYFLESKDDRLIPRGILMHGEAGVGKSCGAKHIANEFGVPLYRLDISGALGKYIGESEGAMSSILNTIDQEAPAVLLIDEVEKLFATREDSDSGVTARLLAQFLWWLSEHKTRVLTVMTTNNLSALPKELYRSGRIDLTLHMPKLSLVESQVLAEIVLRQFIEKATKAQVGVIMSAIKALSSPKTASSHPMISHADVTQTVYDVIKQKGWV
jgi:hypothetical protein